MTFKDLAARWGYRSVKELCREEGINTQTIERIRQRDQDGKKEDQRCREIIADHYNIDGYQLLELINFKVTTYRSIQRAADTIRGNKHQEPTKEEITKIIKR